MNAHETELLAPAGDWESLNAAYRFGADAVYIGGPMLQLRAGKTGFTLPDIARAAQTARAAGKKLYVAVNAFVYPEELEGVGDYARALYDAGAHAVIASDFGAIMEIKRAAPDLDVHLSTQANCTNHLTAICAHNLGASRVVLARELSIAQIAEIRANTPKSLALEAFAHGAMCMAYSGRCLLSSYMTGRSANRGGCAQSCRWSYALTEEKRPGQYFPVEQDARGSTILSSYDLNALPFLGALADAGVQCFKIEGRMKTAYYVATVVNAYRQRLMGADEGACLRELDAISHRPYSSGFYYGQLRAHTPAPEGYLHTRAYAANVIGRGADGRVRILCKNKIEEGARVEAVSPRLPCASFTAQNILDESGAPASAASVPDAIYTLPAPEGVDAGDYLRTCVSI